MLATTDPQKVPVTVLSRCLQFNLRPMAPQNVLAHLTNVLAAESVPAEPGALRLLARAARGSMRDALSLTDQAIAFGAGQLQEEGVRQMLGTVDRGHVVAIVEALVAGSGEAIVAQADALRSQGLSAAGTLEDLATLLQQMAVAQVAPNALDPQEPDSAEAARLAALLPADEIQLIYSMALHGRQELPLAPDEYAGLLMVLLRMLAFRPKGAAGQQPVMPTARAAVAASPATSSAAAPASAPLLRPAAPTLAVKAPQVQPPRAEEATPAPVKPAATPAPAVAPAQPPAAAAAAAAPEIPRAQARGAMPDSPSARLRPRPVAAAPAEESRAASDDELPPWLDAPPADEEGLPIDAADMLDVEPAERTPAARGGASAVSTGGPYASTAGSDVPLQPTALGERWYGMVKQLKLVALPRELALQAECVAVDEQSSPQRWRLRVERESLRQPALQDKLQAALAEALGAAVQLEIEAGIAQDSPALRDQAEAQARQRRAEQIVLEDPFVQQMLAQFKTARIVPGSIKPH